MFTSTATYSNPDQNFLASPEKTESRAKKRINLNAFGMLMPGRQVNSKDYRFGYNGKEMDNEVGGTGNQYDYGFRIYNPRVGKFLSVDPLSKDYPELTTYQYASNRPIDGIDLDGLEYEQYDQQGNPLKDANGDPVIGPTNASMNMPNQGLSPLEVQYVQQLSANGLLPQNTATDANGLPVVPSAGPNTATPTEFSQAQQQFNQTFNPTNNNPRPWASGGSGTTPLYGGNGQPIQVPTDANGNISPALHNFFVQNAIQYAANAALATTFAADLFLQGRDAWNAANGSATNDFRRLQQIRLNNRFGNFFNNENLDPNYALTEYGLTKAQAAQYDNLDRGNTNISISVTDRISRTPSIITIPRTWR